MIKYLIVQTIRKIIIILSTIVFMLIVNWYFLSDLPEGM